jgi:betaine-aldehyde dehydrogenase
MNGRLWIDGRWVEALSGKIMTISNPATGDVVATVADGGAADVAAAVAAAKRAFDDGRWSRKTPAERSKVLWKLADLIEARTEEFAKAETVNTGKPYRNMSLVNDVPFSIDNLRFFAGAARDTTGARAGEFAAGYTSYSRREPVGVVGQIAPWNYPLMMAIWKIGPSLAAGCTVVFKPAPGTPLTALLLAELTKEAGLPDGVFNLVTGGNDAGQALVEHPDVRMVSLTGSTATGKKIMKTAADTLKKVHLELGGKAPLVVFEDADVTLVAAKAAFAATMNTGQDCTAGTRLYVHQSKLKEVTAAVVAAMEAVKTGDPWDDEVFMGPLISPVQKDRVAGFVARAQAAGAKILTGGVTPKGLERGCFFAPTVVAGVDQKAEIVQGEVFGPLLTIQGFTTEDEALSLANDVVYGLAASIFTKDVSRAVRLTGRLEFGTVWVNDHLPIASELPHGGFKQSGFGKDMGAESVGDYLITKHVMISHTEAL